MKALPAARAPPCPNTSPRRDDSTCGSWGRCMSIVSIADRSARRDQAKAAFPFSFPQWAPLFGIPLFWTAADFHKT